MLSVIDLMALRRSSADSVPDLDKALDPTRDGMRFDVVGSLLIEGLEGPPGFLIMLPFFFIVVEESPKLSPLAPRK